MELWKAINKTADNIKKKCKVDHSVLPFKFRGKKNTRQFEWHSSNSHTSATGTAKNTSQCSMNMVILLSWGFGWIEVRLWVTVCYSKDN